MTLPLQEDICLTDVTKVFRTGLFKNKVGVQDLTFSVPRGKVIGLLGPNGSGKSTTIKMVLGFLRPTRGEILVCGHRADERAARKFIGYLPENPRFQKFLTARDVLRYYGGLLGLRGTELEKRADDLLERVSLAHAANERVHGFSKGMTQRLAIAQSLLNRPSLLIFDEPMSGLDPLGRREIRKLIAQIHDDMPECTIFFSTHILNDVEELCSMVAVMRKGRLQTFAPIEQLVGTELARFEIVAQGLPAAEESALMNERQGKRTPVGLCFQIDGLDMLTDYLNRMRQLGATVVSVASQRRNLEESLFKDEGPSSSKSSGSLEGARQ